eukprot:gene3274-1605_t
MHNTAGHHCAAMLVIPELDNRYSGTAKRMIWRCHPFNHSVQRIVQAPEFGTSDLVVQGFNLEAVIRIGRCRHILAVGGQNGTCAMHTSKIIRSETSYHGADELTGYTYRYYSKTPVGVCFAPYGWIYQMLQRNRNVGTSVLMNES